MGADEGAVVVDELRRLDGRHGRPQYINPAVFGEELRLRGPAAAAEGPIMMSSCHMQHFCGWTRRLQQQNKCGFDRFS